MSKRAIGLVQGEAVMELWQHYQQVSSSLNSRVKRTVGQLTPLYRERTRSLDDPHSLCLEAAAVLRLSFPGCSREEIDVLAFYLIGLAALMADDPGGKSWKQELIDRYGVDEAAEILKSAGDLSQMAQIKLQAALERQQKVFLALSNLLKKQHATIATIVQNLKA